MPEGHIFLSYRSIETDFALKLAADLKNAGVNLWMDRLDGIRGGDDWRRQIEEALSPSQCALMLAILSPDYLNAEYCRSELARANRLKIPILPTLLYPLPDVPIEVERLHFIQFCDLDDENRLIRSWRDDALYSERFSLLMGVLPDAQKGNVPDAETQYLITLIAELESRKGVLEYVELSAQADAPKPAEATRPEPQGEDEWAAGFSMLIEKKSDSGGTGRALSAPTHNTSSEKLTFNTIAEAVAQFPRFVLTGEPGAGKTTTIRRLALEAVRKRLENPRAAPLPLLLYLPRWGDEPTPLDFVRKHWPFSNDPAGLLAQGDILLYLDGLNEMGAPGVEKAKKLTTWFESSDGPQQVIVTCRAGDYAGELRLGETPTVLAEEMNEAQIREFAERYLGTKAMGFLERTMPEKKGTGVESHSLLKLAKNPYLLAALLFVYDKEPDGDLPRNNGKLMRALAKALWERERRKQTKGWIPFEEMELHFGALAYSIIYQDQATEVGLDYANKYVESIDVLHAAQQANLLDIHNGNVKFYHQLTLEYFSAVGFKQNMTAHRFVVNPPRFSRSGRISNKWDQVLIALCGITEHSGTLIEKIANIDAYLASMCVESGIVVSDSILKRLSYELRSGFRLTSTVRWEAVKALVRLGEGGVSVLTDSLNDTDPDVRLDAVLGLLQIGTPSIVPGLLKVSDDRDVRTQLPDRLEDIIILLSSLDVVHQLTQYPYEPIRIAAIEAIERLSDIQAIPLLVHCLEDVDYEVRYAAASALQNMKWKPSSMDLSFYIALRDWKSVIKIGKSATPRLLELLEDKNRGIQLSAVQAIVEIGDQTAVQRLLYYLRSSSNALVAEHILRLGTVSAISGVVAWWSEELNESSGDRQKESIAALTRIGTPESLAAVEQWRAKRKKLKLDE